MNEGKKQQYEMKCMEKNKSMTKQNPKLNMAFCQTKQDTNKKASPSAITVNWELSYSSHSACNHVWCQFGGERELFSWGN